MNGRIFDALREVGLTNFIQVERGLVVAEVAGKCDAIAIGDFATDAGLANRDCPVPGHDLEEVITALDLELIKTRQQGSETDEHECRQ